MKTLAGLNKGNQMKDYTVVLLRPDYMDSDEPYGQDVYVATVKAETEYTAIPVAQAEAFKVDSKDGLQPRSSGDYAVVLVFDGHVMPKLWGWML